MRQKIVAGNWKMNLNRQEANRLVDELNRKEFSKNIRVILFPSSIYISELSGKVDIDSQVGAQNFHFEESGAFTGELSISQLKSVGCEIGLIGHSERREYFNETNGMLKQKVDAAISSNFEFIFCCGEPLSVRESGKELEFVKQQLEESLFHLTPDQMRSSIIAYEPIWAIGTGLTATSEQAEEMHAAIRSWVEERYTSSVAESVSILYGGSCKPSNAMELFSCPNVDGGLIGGASLDADSFEQIIREL